MIRKTIIVLLTLAAVGTAYGSIVGDPRYIYKWDDSDQLGVGCMFSIRALTLSYFKVGDPSKPVIRRYWGGFGVVRIHFYTQPQKVYAST